MLFIVDSRGVGHVSVDIAFRSPEFMNGHVNGACPVDSYHYFAGIGY